MRALKPGQTLVSKDSSALVSACCGFKALEMNLNTYLCIHFQYWHFISKAAGMHGAYEYIQLIWEYKATLFRRGNDCLDRYWNVNVRMRGCRGNRFSHQWYLWWVSKEEGERERGSWKESDEWETVLVIMLYLRSLFVCCGRFIKDQVGLRR